MTNGSPHPLENLEAASEPERSKSHVSPNIEGSIPAKSKFFFYYYNWSQKIFWNFIFILCINKAVRYLRFICKKISIHVHVSLLPKSLLTRVICATKTHVFLYLHTCNYTLNTGVIKQQQSYNLKMLRKSILIKGSTSTHPKNIR